MHMTSTEAASYYRSMELTHDLDLVIFVHIDLYKYSRLGTYTFGGNIVFTDTIPPPHRRVAVCNRPDNLLCGFRKMPRYCGSVYFANKIKQLRAECLESK